MKIAVLGMGRSGLSVYRCLKSQKKDFVLINSGLPESWPCFEQIKEDLDKAYSQENAINILDKISLIILSPGIPNTIPLLMEATRQGIKIISEIEYAYLDTDIPRIAITGTNGKTTTTTMIGAFLKSIGKKPFVCGNIGIPYADILLTDEKFDCAVIELSSFQLESVEEFKADIGIFLNLSENHMERYETVEEYKQAKMNIFNNQTKDNYSLTYEPMKTVSKNYLIKELAGFDFSKSNLVGEHNKLNFFCAYMSSKLLLGDDVDIDQDFQNFINTFQGVELRLEFIGEAQNLKFYNDGKSTNNAATMAAINSFEKTEELIVILGGKLRTEKVDIHKECDFSKFKKVICFGEARDLLKESINTKNCISFEDLEEVTEHLKVEKYTGTVLFSPAFPSFDQYKNYIERGAHYTKLIKDKFEIG